MMSNRSRDDFDRLMTGWMVAEGRVREPEDLIDRVLERTSVARRLPRWLVPEWWMSMQNITRLQTVWRPGPVLLLVGALLVALAAVAVFLAGAQRHVPAPFGPAANGRIAYDTRGAIELVNQTGSGGRSLITTIANASGPVFSPDGTHLAIWGDDSPDTLYIADAECGNVRPLVGSLWITTDMPPAWSPDSQRLAFSTESGPEMKDEHLLIVDTRTGSTLTIDRAATGGARLLAPTWSPDGKLIAFLAMNPQTERLRIWVVRPDGTGARELPTSEPTGTNVGADWAPFATKHVIAFNAVSAGQHAIVTTFDLDRGVEQQLSRSDAEPATWPAWSPEGTRLAWLGASGAGSVFVASVDGLSTPTKLLGSSLGGPLAWSPDGTRLFGLTASGTALVVGTVDGSGAPLQLPHKASAGLPDWQRLAP